MEGDGGRGPAAQRSHHSLIPLRALLQQDEAAQGTPGKPWLLLGQLPQSWAMLGASGATVSQEPPASLQHPHPSSQGSQSLPRHPR